MSAESAVVKRGRKAEVVLRPAPPGFTKDQWATFERDGILVIPDAINPLATDSYLDAARRYLDADGSFDPRHTWKIRDLIRRDSLFEELIDHPRHIGFAYDLYGDQTRLAQADMFARPKGSVINHWHVDGPRALPYRVFSPVLPLKLRIGYWLTDVPHGDMGNLVYLPGSHRADYRDDHAGLADIEGQKTLCCTAGTLTIAHASLWHRVCGNTSDRTRINLFLSYTPSWITGYYSYDPNWLNALSREQRILLRSYVDSEDLTRPPSSDIPLFLDPGSAVGEEHEIHKIRRLTRFERQFRNLP